MDERVDIWSASGKPTGKHCWKSEAHLHGWFHPTIHLWLYHPDKGVVLQQRAFNKATFPGMWDVSVAGHVAAGDTPDTTVIREAKEELGLEIKIEDLNFAGVYRSEIQHGPELNDREFLHIYTCSYSGTLDNLKLQEEEVAAVQWMPLTTYLSRLKMPDAHPELVPLKPDYLQLLKGSLDHL